MHLQNKIQQFQVNLTDAQKQIMIHTETPMCYSYKSVENQSFNVSYNQYLSYLRIKPKNSPYLSISANNTPHQSPNKFWSASRQILATHSPKNKQKSQQKQIKWSCQHQQNITIQEILQKSQQNSSIIYNKFQSSSSKQQILNKITSINTQKKQNIIQKDQFQIDLQVNYKYLSEKFRQIASFEESQNYNPKSKNSEFKKLYSNINFIHFSSQKIQKNLQQSRLKQIKQQNYEKQLKDKLQKQNKQQKRQKPPIKNIKPEIQQSKTKKSKFQKHLDFMAQKRKKGLFVNEAVKLAKRYLSLDALSNLFVNNVNIIKPQQKNLAFNKIKISKKYSNSQQLKQLCKSQSEYVSNLKIQKL